MNKYSVNPKYFEKLNQYPFDRTVQTIKKWLLAWAEAENIYLPRRHSLIDVYDMAMLDLHLSGVIENRKNKVIGEPFYLFKNDKIDKDITKNLKQKWFSDFINHCLDSHFYGFSLLEMDYDIENKKVNVNLIERRNVVPDLKEVFINFYDAKGVSYEQYPLYYIPVQGNYGLGLLNKVVPWTISKRFAGNTHDSLNEKFGKPFLIAKTDKSDDERTLIEKALLELGTNGIAVIETTEILDIIYPSSANSAYQNFDTRIERANTEMSKGVMGHTKPADDNQSKTTYVNQQESDKTPTEERKESDMFFIENIVNEELLPRLVIAGFSEFENTKFKFQWTWQKENKKEVISENMLKIILDNYEVEEEWIKENLGIPVKKKTNLAPNLQPNLQPKVQPENEIKDFYNQLHFSFENGILEDIETFFNSFTSTFLKIARSIWRGKDVNKNKKMTDLIAKPFISAVEKNTTEIVKNDFIEKLKNNIFAFSGAKTYKELQEINKLLLDENGNKKTWNKFKKDVLALHETYNKNYLQAEYDLAISQSQMATKWFELTENDANVLLVYSAVGDKRTSTLCNKINKVIKPANDSFWKSYYPPNHWRCRSTVRRAVDNEKESEINKDDLPKFEGPDKIFKGNVALDGIIFPKNHPYFKEMPKE